VDKVCTLTKISAICSLGQDCTLTAVPTVGRLSLPHPIHNIYHAADHGKATLLFSLDLSAAIDTIDHPLLLHRLSHSFGITGSALTWVQSYLTGRSQTVRLGSHCSGSTPCPVGVPQGSVLGSLLFTIYTSPISHIAEAHNI